jgi:hypothetical protein
MEEAQHIPVNISVLSEGILIEAADDDKQLSQAKACPVSPVSIIRAEYAFYRPR